MDQPRVRTSRNNYYWLIPVSLVALAVSAFLFRGRGGTPTVSLAEVWTDTVHRGTLLHEVAASGTLIPENIVLISAASGGRVEQKRVTPGATVRAGEVLLELSNSEVQLQLLESERQFNDARVQLISERVALESQKLQQEAAVAGAEQQYREAHRVAETNRGLRERQLIALNEAAASLDRESEMAQRLAAERKRLKLMSDAINSQLQIKQEQVARLREIVAFHKSLVQSMVVRARGPGVVQDMPLEIGQWVTPGTMLARLVEPGRMRAQLRVSETDIRDIAAGQRVSIDTHAGKIAGHIVRVDPAAQQGIFRVDVGLDSEPPKGARADMSVDASIEVARLADVLYVKRPPGASPNSQSSIFKLQSNGRATRIPVTFGRMSLQAAEIKAGVSVGDVLVLSDLPELEHTNTIRIKR